jgi:hypothetical protein
MAPQIITAIRWFFLIGAVLSFLQATVLFGVFQRWFIEPWFRLNERVGGRIPPVMKDRRFQRGWPLLMTVVFGVMWWLTGTVAGQAWLQRAGR